VWNHGEALTVRTRQRQPAEATAAVSDFLAGKPGLRQDAFQAITAQLKLRHVLQPRRATLFGLLPTLACEVPFQWQ